MSVVYFELSLISSGEQTYLDGKKYVTYDSYLTISPCKSKKEVDSHPGCHSYCVLILGFIFSVHLFNYNISG